MEIRKELNDCGNTTIKGLKHGIYEVYWKSGGSSLAAIGYDSDGNNWIQPCNWISTNATIDYWDNINAIRMLIPNDYSKITKAIKSEYRKQLISEL